MNFDRAVDRFDQTVIIWIKFLDKIKRFNNIAFNFLNILAGTHLHSSLMMWMKT